MSGAFQKLQQKTAKNSTTERSPLVADSWNTVIPVGFQVTQKLHRVTFNQRNRRLACLTCSQFPVSTLCTSKKRSDMSWASVSLVVSMTLFWAVELMQISGGNTALVPEEEEALEILRESFNLSRWSGDPCDNSNVDWITCSSDSVSALNLPQKKLTGFIPAEIAKLRNIRSLILSDNSLTGPIPDLTNMTSLTSLALEGNNLTGGIPPSIFNHSTLKTLNLSKNPLGGSIPDVIDLTSLSALDLTQTQVIGSIPDSIKSMTRLEILNLGSNPQLSGSVTVMDDNLYNIRLFNGSRCALSGDLPTLFKAGGLEMLDLQMNDLSGSISRDMFQHQSLQLLDLSNNPKLSGEIPDMSPLQDINNFFASDCDFYGALRDGFFSNNSNLEYIGLWNNRLSAFPTDLQNLVKLQKLDVHNNNITGVLPDLPPSVDQKSSKSLKCISFSNNRFYGGIPSSWNQLTYLEGMFVAFNNLSGVIQKEIGSLTNLRSLNLSNNNFSGPIPEEFGDLSMLEILDLRNNEFSGTVPENLASLRNLRILLLDNNRFTEIPKSLTNRTDIQISYTNNPGIQIVDPASAKKKSGLSTVTIVGVVIGVCASLGISVLSIMIYTNKRKRKNAHADQISKEDMPKSAQGFTLKHIKALTENYKTLIGKGGFGPVYYGKLSDGKEVAVKVRATNSKQGAEEFLNEVRLLSRLHHRNLVSLVGYCLEEHQQILVYDYMSEGTLHDHLYLKDRGSSSSYTSSDSSKYQPLSWKTRLSIALSAAKGLEYLHKDCNPSVIHRDVKSSNILLTDKLQAKVADLGISKQASELDSEEKFNKSGLSTVIKGTVGYLDPEYFVRRKLTTKSDVFSFGMVLLEIITAKRPQTHKFPGSEATNLRDWVRDALSSDRFESIVDPVLQGEYDRGVMLNIARTALSCTLSSGPERPDMGDITRALTQALHMEGEFVETTSSAQAITVVHSFEQELPLSSADASSSSCNTYSHPSWLTEPR